MPHIPASIPRSLLQFVNLGFNVKELDALKTGVNESRNTIEESQTENIPVEKKNEGRPGKSEELVAEPPAALRLRSRQ
jgi:hypothetical protein